MSINPVVIPKYAPEHLSITIIEGTNPNFNQCISYDY